MPRYGKRRYRRSTRPRRGGRRRIASRLSVHSRSASRTLAQNAKGYTRALTGFPNEMRVVLPYADNRRVNPGVAYGSDTVYNINSCFDPENTGGGHQPRGFDQWAGVYNKYRVNKLTIDYEIRQRGAHGIMGYIVVNNDVGTLSTNNESAEYNNAINLGSTSSNVRPLSGTKVFWPHKILGKSWQQYISDEDCSALVTTDPTELIFLHLLAQQIDETTACDYEIQITIFMDVTFYDRKNLAIS